MDRRLNFHSSLVCLDNWPDFTTHFAGNRRVSLFRKEEPALLSGRIDSLNIGQTPFGLSVLDRIDTLDLEATSLADCVRSNHSWLSRGCHTRDYRSSGIFPVY